MLVVAFVLVFSFARAAAYASGFGVEPGAFTTTLSDARAGAHADLVTAFTLNQEPANSPAGYLKDIHLSLPPGLVGNPQATPRCDMGDVEKSLCPENTAVGVVEVKTARPPKFESLARATVLVYNVAPYPNEPAAYAFNSGSLTARFDATLSAEGNYGLTLNATDLSDAQPLVAATVTLWGVPQEHNGPGSFETSQCHINEVLEVEECVTYGGAGSGVSLPFLSNPVACGLLPRSVLTVDAWQEPGIGRQATASAGAITNCEGPAFEPSISIVPGLAQARAPAGYAIAVRMPVAQSAAGHSDADLREAKLELPTGIVISPSAGEDLQACSAGEFELEPRTSEPTASRLPVSGPQAARCPLASQIGTASIKTPLLSEALHGQLFLGTPECAPCTTQDAQAGRMVRLLLQAAGSGVLIKLQGSISVNEATGRLTAIIDNSPQLPVEELELTLNGGPHALLANPAECAGPLQGSGQLTPYNTETPTEVTAASTQLTGCGPPRFAPTFSAGTVTNQGGSTSTAIISISRADQDQTLGRFTVNMPPGLLGLLSKVPACPQAAAQLAACGAQSELGSVSIAAGPGSEPLNLKGSVFLTGPHDGAPFGLSIVVPAQAGPIDLGSIDIQAGIQIDPATAALTIASDPLPQSLAGVPLQIRALNLEISRAGFIVNPTSCRPKAIDATLASAQEASAGAFEHFQAAGCAKLTFKPTLTALSNARTTRLGGAYLHVKLTSAPGQANVEKLKLDLPKALPSRLTTLQGACREATFKADPARCPASSVLGTGAVTTPFLRALLTGPVYMVSHGARGFPDLDAVLQGEGVTLVLVGTSGFTHGISSEAFRSLPDAPISTLDLMFPAGPNSAFAANANLCKRKLPTPTEITGQNGAVVKQTIKIAVSGCSGARVKPRRKEAP